MTKRELLRALKGKRDEDPIDITTDRKHQPVGSAAMAMPGCWGTVVLHSPSSSVIRCRVRNVRHLLRFLEAA